MTFFHLGYTGTRRGMSPAQYQRVEDLCRSAGALPFFLVAHHGDCEGGDAQFHRIMHELGARLVIHPPVDETYRAHCKPWDEMRPALSHLARNRGILAESMCLIAAPFQMSHQVRGGTWYTHDRAIRDGVPVALVLPDGSVSHPGKAWPTS